MLKKSYLKFIVVALIALHALFDRGAVHLSNELFEAFVALKNEQL